jgi:Ni,Fe-hydrogenase III large subunit
MTCRSCEPIAMPGSRRARARSDLRWACGLQDRFAKAGCVPAELARRLELTGLAARASGVGTDLRRDAWDPSPIRPGRTGRHVPRRRRGGTRCVRFAEVFESCACCAALVRKNCPTGPGAAPKGRIAAARRLRRGMDRGWRGEMLVAVELDERGLILRAHCHDPSWQNWPALEHAVIGNIVPDFPPDQQVVQPELFGAGSLMSGVCSNRSFAWASSPSRRRWVDRRLGCAVPGPTSA